jgi:hypothetical protein
MTVTTTTQTGVDMRIGCEPAFDCGESRVCPEGVVCSAEGGCVCDDGYYNAASLAGGWSFVTCHTKNQDYEEPRETLTDSRTCRPCPDACATCSNGMILVKPGYSPAFAVTGEGLPLPAAGAAVNGPHRPLFACTKEEDQCVGGSDVGNDNTTSTTMAWCAKGYAGPLCSNCNQDLGYARRGLNRKADCTDCDSSFSGLFAAVLILLVLVAAYFVNWAMAASISGQAEAAKVVSLKAGPTRQGGGRQQARQPGHLRTAAAAGDLAWVAQLLEAGVDVNAAEERLADWGPLQYAAQGGHADGVYVFVASYF